MPELPEVETMCRGIAHLAGRRIATARFPRGTVRPIRVEPSARVVAARLAGRTIAGVGRFGKRVAIEFSPRGRTGPEWLVIEPRMTGLMLVADPPTVGHVRMEILFEREQAPGLLFWDRRGLGTIRLLDRPGLAAVCGETVLGPDGLTITAQALRDRLGRSRRAVKVALLDQRAVAGIGNIYAAEILHAAGVDPRASCRRLSGECWERIAASARVILADAVRLEGSSIGDETYQTADRRPGRYQGQHRVYGRADQPCGGCGRVITRLVQAQRSTFFCGNCQWRPRRRRHTV
jgi:formamidopyrimidine-DNA glycosylase